MMVSCVMPTRGRKEFAIQALACFMSQTYANRELIILDDLDDRSFPLGVMIDGVHYAVNSTRFNIPEKRNQVCSMAKGDVICHWDSDDWSAPGRVEFQADLFERSRVALVGFNSMLFYDERDGTASKYFGSKLNALGTSLFYSKAWWRSEPWATAKAIASDNAFVKVAADRGQLVTLDAEQLMVARAHADNTSRKRLHLTPYQKVSLESLPEGFKR